MSDVMVGRALKMRPLLIAIGEWSGSAISRGLDAAYRRFIETILGLSEVGAIRREC